MKFNTLFELIAANPKLKNLTPEVVEQFNELSHAELVAFQKKNNIINSEIRMVRTREDGTKEIALVFKYVNKGRSTNDASKYDVKLEIWPGTVKMNLHMKDDKGVHEDIDVELSEIGFAKLFKRMQNFMDFQSTFERPDKNWIKNPGQSVLNDKKAS